MRVNKSAAVVLMVLTLLDLPSRIASKIAIDPKRSKFMKDAISWVKFRRDGIPITDDVIERGFYPKLSSHYAASKAFRAFVIAFEQGVSPRLTLQNTQKCDPAYPKQFKNPENGMVDWHSMKKFVFENYKRRKDPNFKKEYCDYRKGLICLPSGQCGCNTGATFSAISSGSSEQGCVLEPGQVCAIPDLEQGAGHKAYRDSELSRLVFNLEKPESCKPGFVCRNKNSDHLLPKCYDENIPKTDFGLSNGEGTGTRWVIEIGSECPLGLINIQVKCDIDVDVGNAPGYVCYKFAPADTFTRTGFCAHEFGSYQIYNIGFKKGKITDAIMWRRNSIMGFVNRYTVPLFDGAGLKAYYQKYLSDVYGKLYPSGSDTDETKWTIKVRSGDSCNEAKTKEMDSIWKFYAGLVANPPTTTVTSLTDMNNKLKTLSEMVERNKGGICKPYWSYHFKDYKDEQNPHNYSPDLLPPLECVKDSSATGDDDGKCKVKNDDTTKPFAEKVQRLSNHALDAVYANKDEESNPEYLQILKDNPDPECKPLGKQTRSRAVWPLEDLSCPPGSVCLPNYEDSSVFDQNCNVKPDRQQKVCLKTSGKSRGCEEKILDKDIMKEIQAIISDKDALLGEGADCDHDLENQVRAGVKSGEWTGNKRELLAKLRQGRVRGVICDRSRLLECSDEKICACLSGTDQREVVIMDSDAEYHYKSHYCYLTSGTCSAKGLQDFLKDLPLFQKENELIKDHYGSAGEDCTKGNHCKFVDQGSKQCTERDTLKTGHDLTPDRGDGNNGDGNGGAGGGEGNGGGSSGGGGRPGGSNPPGNDSPERKSSVGGLLTIILLIVR